jgi:hypothetical protein
MKFISVTILLICLISATFSQWLLIACFDINETYIAKELCVNKNNPSAHCNGHCYLNKELNKEEKSNNPLGTSSKEKFEIQLFCIDASSIINVVSSSVTTAHSELQNFVAQEFLHNNFHPPSMA